MRAVALWPEIPDAEALLAARLERGWSPTATPMRGGDRVLGYAACLAEGPEQSPARAEAGPTSPGA